MGAVYHQPEMVTREEEWPGKDTARVLLHVVDGTGEIPGLSRNVSIYAGNSLEAI